MLCLDVKVLRALDVDQYRLAAMVEQDVGPRAGSRSRPTLAGYLPELPLIYQASTLLLKTRIHTQGPKRARRTSARKTGT